MVEQIRPPYPVLATEDGEQITIPNKEIIGQILENSFECKLVETIVGISPSADPEIAIDALRSAIQQDDIVSTDPCAADRDRRIHRHGTQDRHSVLRAYRRLLPVKICGQWTDLPHAESRRGATRPAETGDPAHSMTQVTPSANPSPEYLVQ